MYKEVEELAVKAEKEGLLREAAILYCAAGAICAGGDVMERFAEMCMSFSRFIVELAKGNNTGGNLN